MISWFTRQPLRMCTNVVYFSVMRRLCRREWNWLWNWRCVRVNTQKVSEFWGPVKVREKKCLRNGKSFVELETFMLHFDFIKCWASSLVAVLYFYQHKIFSDCHNKSPFKNSAPSRDGDEVSAPSRRWHSVT